MGFSESRWRRSLKTKCTPRWVAMEGSLCVSIYPVRARSKNLTAPADLSPTNRPFVGHCVGRESCTHPLSGRRLTLNSLQRLELLYQIGWPRIQRKWCWVHYIRWRQTNRKMKPELRRWHSKNFTQCCVTNMLMASETGKKSNFAEIKTRNLIGLGVLTHVLAASA